MMGVLIPLVGLLMIAMIPLCCYFEKRRSGDSAVDPRYPIITYDQFKSFYATAPDKWRWNEDRGEITYRIFPGTCRTFSYAIKESKKFDQLFQDLRHRRKEESDAKIIAECIDYWREDAKDAEIRAAEELERARKEYERIKQRNENGCSE